MTATLSHGTPAVFELATATSWRNPWPMYQALRDHDPVHHVVPPDKPDHDYFVLSRHADVWESARDHETFSSAQGLTVNYGELELIGLQDNPPMVMQDPPVHTEFRKLVARGFTPRQVAAVEPAVRAFVVERLERLLASGGGDIVAELFKPLPSMVVAHYLGVPESDRKQFDGWTEAIVAANTVEGGIANALETLGDAVGSMMAYFTALIERRRKDPGDDTVSHLVAAGVGADGDIAGTLSILAFTFTMVTGGNDTVTGMLGGAVQLLHQRPDQRRLLAENPELIADSVDEFLRLTAPAQCLGRTVTRDVTLHGTTIPEGRRVLFLYGSANRDERQYGPNAAELDVTRRPAKILTFSHGAHHCIGATAARMQSRVALTELLSRCPDFEVDEDAIVWAGGSYVRRPLSVPFTVKRLPGRAKRREGLPGRAKRREG
ncbi:MAG: cytochrome family [Mycobacterium sp.]|nr:cytochrome family [Mycobacterium sp.]